MVNVMVTAVVDNKDVFDDIVLRKREGRRLELLLVNPTMVQQREERMGE